MSDPTVPILVTEDPVPFGEHTYTARRSADDDPPRWQIFRGDELSPVGFVEMRHDPEFDAVRLFVYDGNGVQIGRESVHSYPNALSHIRMRGLEQS